MINQKSIIFVEKAFLSFSKLLILHLGSPLRGRGGDMKKGEKENLQL